MVFAFQGTCSFPRCCSSKPILKVSSAQLHITGGGSPLPPPCPSSREAETQDRTPVT
jgi:hypothetical protein